MKPICLLIAAGLLVLPGCSRKARNEAAVQQAIEQYLSSRSGLNMGGMDMQVSGVTLRADTAEADVVFRAKNDAKAVLTMHYKLRRRGSGWEVIPQSGGHVGAMPAAPGEGPGELPAGHPPAGSSSPAPEPPPKHPPVKSQ